MNKKLIWLFMAIGGAIGGYIPQLWGVGYFSFSSILCNAIGALIGIWFAVKISNY